MSTRKQEPKRKPAEAARRSVPTSGLTVLDLGGGAFIFATPGATGTVTYTALDGSTKTVQFQT